MLTSDTTQLTKAIQRAWPNEPGEKARRYIGAFFDRVRVAKKITAKVIGNHGFCHHCAALGKTFLQDPSSFQEIKLKKREDVHGLGDVQAYLQGVTLEALLKQLSEQGITQKAFAESIGMNSRHLSAIKSSEARNHFFNELGATKLACQWVLEHLDELKPERRHNHD